MAIDVDPRTVVATLDESWKKHRPFKTIALFVTFCCLGLSSSVLGPTLVSMEYLLNTDTEHISATFTGGALGYLIGAMLCGFDYSKLNKELLFALSLIGIGATMAYAPFSPNLIVFIIINCCQSIFMGIIDTAGQTYLLRLWQDHRYRRSLMQCLHCVWSVGATVAPFIVHNFLVDVPQEVDDDVRVLVTRDPELYPATRDNTTEELYQAQPPITNVDLVRIPYVVVSTIVAASSVLFLINFFVVGTSCLDPSRERGRRPEPDNTVGHSIEYKRIYFRFLVLLFWIFFVQIWLDCIPASLVAVFVVRGLNWQNERGALITSAYSAFHGLSRIIAIPLAAILSPTRMLIIDMTIVTAGYGLLLFVNFHHSIPWIAASVSGFGIGSAFPSCLLWAEGFIEITSAASSVFVTAISVGAMVGPALTGFLMGYFTYMCFVYVLLSAAFILLIVNVSAAFYARRMGLQNRSYSKSKPISVKATSEEISTLRRTRLQEKSTSSCQIDDNLGFTNSLA